MKTINGATTEMTKDKLCSFCGLPLLGHTAMGIKACQESLSTWTGTTYTSDYQPPRYVISLGTVIFILVLQLGIVATSLIYLSQTKAMFSTLHNDNKVVAGWMIRGDHSCDDNLKKMGVTPKYSTNRYERK